MTTSSYTKVFKQLKSKPAILAKYKKHNKPKKRTCGFMLKRCKRCGRTGAHISSWSLHLCRQCFREIAQNMGFKKYD